MSRQLPQPSRDSINLITVLAALADPVRLALMQAMYSRTGPVDCAVIAQGVEVGAPTVSHHYRVLRDAGLTTTTVEGRRRVITIRHEDLEARFPGLLAAVLTPAAKI
ncbi:MULTISPECIES: ArsR/SmtB family transcription factor [Frankia]|uniref:Transcriptional regulator, arsR family n=1 Tax=Frankia alni (strain DSM 45986 / CECT 9034 / ACN14a) TaxID=326424 RepID=Q0RI30_FRAAA|nr:MULTISPECIES: helix-turn-helix domain-containing protein [Frankia]CAJ62842.1 Putative transcriptional regulator, arsR family [Frankia alni ACN14a]